MLGYSVGSRGGGGGEAEVVQHGWDRNDIF